MAGRWADSDASERSSFRRWLLDFCDALGVANAGIQANRVLTWHRTERARALRPRCPAHPRRHSRHPARGDQRDPRDAADPLHPSDAGYRAMASRSSSRSSA